MKVLGVDCPSCGALINRQCPDCQTPFLRRSRHCESCGRSIRHLNLYNARPYRFPRALDVREYEYGADRKAKEAMSLLVPVKMATRYVIEKIHEPMFHGALLGSAVKVSDRQFPEIRRIARHCEAALHLEPVDIFVQHSSALQAYAYGTQDTHFLVVTSRMVENLDGEELAFVIGHEMGHIKSDHVLYLTIARLLQQGVAAIPMVGDTIAALLKGVILPWQRKAEVTADRAGFICCQNLVTVVRTLIKLAVGSRELFERVDADEFLGQAGDLGEKLDWGEYLAQHPFIINRIRLLDEFVQSPRWYRILAKTSHPLEPRFACPYCDHWGYLSDETAVVRDLVCKACGKSMFLESLPCPHCATRNELDATTSLSSFVCKHCERPYLTPELEALRESLPDDAPLEDHYARLGIRPWAPAEEVELAYLGALRDTGGRVEAKLELARAYRQLGGLRRRIEYDRRRDYVLDFLRQGRVFEGVHGPLPLCPTCRVPNGGRFCALCGRIVTEEVDTLHDERLKVLRTALQLHPDASSLVSWRQEADFPLAFESNESLWFFLAENSLDNPNAMRAIVKKCNERSHRAQQSAWLGVECTFVTVVAACDPELLAKILRRHFVSRKGFTLHCRFLVCLRGAQGWVLDELGAEGWQRRSLETDAALAAALLATVQD